jgi:hypothetical protein
MFKRFAILVLFSLAACNTPLRGDPCTQENAIVCESASVALICQSGRLFNMDCRGPGGCREEGERGTCDMSRAQQGDTCSLQAEGQSQCDVSDVNRSLVCASGGVWAAQTCKACTMQDGKAVCQP